jgi:glycerol uptake facilitator-like aquaporin
MKTLRRVHLYLGCFFAPLLLFYVLTGWYQTTHPDRRKDLGEARDWIGRFMSVHVDQIFPTDTANHYSPGLYRWLIVLMSMALITTIVLGIILAFQVSRSRWPVWLVLSLGLLAPILLLWLGQSR